MEQKRLPKEELVEIYQKLIDHINSVGIFWVHDLRSLMGCASSESSKNSKNIQITNLLIRLKNKGIIQCSEVRGSNRQYMLIKKIQMEEIFTYNPNAPRQSKHAKKY